MKSIEEAKAMLQQLHDNLWIAEMPASRGGFEFGARMTVVRLESGALWIHSPIELSPVLKQELDALGEIGFVVSPFRFHYQHLEEFYAAYPNARFYAAPNFNMKKMKSVRFAGRLRKAPHPEWAVDLDQLPVRGNALDDEIVFFHKASRTLIVTDLLFNIPDNRSRFTSVVAGVLGVRENLAPSRNFKLFTRNKTLVRQTVRKILEWDFDRIILAHGDIVKNGGREKFKQAFAYLFSR
jgi:hypothetical protein